MMLQLEYTSVGCNRVANVLDWSSNGEVAYGAHSNVAIYDVEVHFASWLLQNGVFVQLKADKELTWCRLQESRLRCTVTQAASTACDGCQIQARRPSLALASCKAN